MAFLRRKRSNRRRGKRVSRRTRRIRSSPSIHKFKEMYKLGPVGAPASAIGSGVLAPKGISELANVAHLTGLFDLYKITGVKYKIVPRYNSADPSATITLPMIYLATNRDPFTPAPSSVGDILNDDTCKSYRLDKPISWFVKCPKPDMSISFDIGGTQYVGPQQWQLGVATKYQPWLTTGGNNQSLDQSARAHYGVRWVVDNFNSFPVDVDVYATLYFQMKEQD